MNAKDVWIGDFEIGDSFQSQTYEVTEDEIIEFGKKYDPQPFHIDPERAKNSFFGGLAASGWLTVGISMRLLMESHPFGFDMVGIENKLKWPSPTRPGDILRINTEIHDLKMSRSKPNRGVITLKVTTRNQEDEVRMVMLNKIIGYIRPEESKK